jgi:endoglucanase
LLLLLVCTIISTRQAHGQAAQHIRLNQIGFYTSADKIAIAVDATAAEFLVLTSDLADTVFAGSLSDGRTWIPAGETARIADFSALDRTGEFVLAVPGLGISHPFEIRPYVHQDVARAALKAYYFQRASILLEPEYAGAWARPAGHPDTEVIVHPSAASTARPAGTVIAAPRGWYDAGDYNKYVVNSGISVGTLLMAYEHHPGYFDALETNIPESENAVPDVLDEVLWNIRWMLDMQDSEDGGVYHKLTTPNFEGAVMPHTAAQPRYVVQKGTAATLDFAAVMAMGARTFDDFEDEFPGLADSMLTAANAAWKWARANPNISYNQEILNQAYEPDINTGAYGDGNFGDEFRWAAAELFISTGQDSFVVAHDPLAEGNLSAPGWPNVGTMAFFSLAHHGEAVAGTIDTTVINGRLLDLADEYVDAKRDSPFDIVMGRPGDFFWGSNSLAGNQGVVLMQAYRLTGEQLYLEAALSNLDYLLGRNAVGYSFVTGHGDATPMNIHHRQSESDNVPEPVPGLLAGGPNAGRQDNCAYASALPAKSYVDDWCSYASNEVTINWNAPFVYLAGAIEAAMSPSGLPVSAPINGRFTPSVPIEIEIESYPNPAVDLTQIRFTLDKPAQVKLRAFDVLGRKISTLSGSKMLTAGSHEATLDVSDWMAGLYVVRLESATATASCPLMVVR